MKPIRVISSGGTWCMGPNQEGRLAVLPLLQMHASILALADGHPIELTPWLDKQGEPIPAVDSSAIGPRHWQQLAEQVLRELSDYQGFVLLHGTDTLAYSGAALTFALQAVLQKAGKALVLTGSQRPLLASDSDAKANIQQALIEARKPNEYGVKLLFGSGCWPAVCASKVDSDADNGFSARRLNDRVAAFTAEEYPDATLFANGVVDITLQPALNPETLLGQLLAPGVRLAVVRLYGAGTVAPEWRLLETLQQAQSQSHGRFLGALAISACTNGALDWGRYAASPAADIAGLLVNGVAMTPEAAVTKCSWVLGSAERTENALALLATNIAGELS